MLCIWKTLNKKYGKGLQCIIGHWTISPLVRRICHGKVNFRQQYGPKSTFSFSKVAKAARPKVTRPSKASGQNFLTLFFSILGTCMWTWGGRQLYGGLHRFLRVVPINLKLCKLPTVTWSVKLVLGKKYTPSLLITKVPQRESSIVCQ